MPHNRTPGEPLADAKARAAQINEYWRRRGSTVEAKVVQLYYAASATEHCYTVRIPTAVTCIPPTRRAP